MATYPLKNLAIDGNIYQIAGGTEYVSVVLKYTLENTSTTFSGTLAEIMANNNGSWSIVSITKGGVSYDPDVTMLNTLTGFKQYRGTWTVRDANGINSGEFANMQTNYQYFAFAIPGKTMTNAFTGMVKLLVDEANNYVTEKGILLPSSGSGGSTITTYYVFGGASNRVTFSNMINSVTLSTSSSSVTPASFAMVKAAYAQGTVRLIDANDEYADINGCYDTMNDTLTVAVAIDSTHFSMRSLRHNFNGQYIAQNMSITS